MFAPLSSNSRAVLDAIVAQGTSARAAPRSLADTPPQVWPGMAKMGRMNEFIQVIMIYVIGFVYWDCFFYLLNFYLPFSLLPRVSLIHRGYFHGERSIAQHAAAAVVGSWVGMVLVSLVFPKERSEPGRVRNVFGGSTWVGW